MRTRSTAIVAESRPAFADLILRLLGGDLGVETTLTADSLDGAINAMIATHPDLASIDRDWPGCNPLAVLPLVCQQLPGTCLVLTGEHFSTSDIARMRNMGARGCILKSAPAEEILAAFKAVLAGGTAFPDTAHKADAVRHAPRRRPHTPPRPIEGLTVRELQVLTHVGRGLSTKEIATALNVSVETADRHRTNLMAKLDIHDRVGLALCAVREGLVTP